MIAWAPTVLKRIPLSLPIVCVAIGFALFSFAPFSSWAPHPDKTPTLGERAAELIVIVSLMGGGLKIERAVAWGRIVNKHHDEPRDNGAAVGKRKWASSSVSPWVRKLA